MSEEQLIREALAEANKEFNLGAILSNKDRARLIAQGAALGYGDEIEALIRSMSPDVTYDEAVDEIRKSIDVAKERFPIQATALEVGGALIPGIAAAPFTAGGSLVPTLGRAAAVGAVEGAIYGSGQGTDAESRFKEGAKGAVTGAILNPAVQKGMEFVTGGAAGIGAYLRKKMGNKLAKPVEDEIMRIVEGSGISVEEIVNRIRDGEILPDMSESALTELRGYAAQGGAGQEIISDTLRARSDRLRTDAIEGLQSGLAVGVPEGNITMAFNKNVKELKADESKAYKDLFSAPENNQLISPNNLLSGPNISQEVIEKAQIGQQLSAVSEELLQDFPFLRNKVNAIFKAKKMPLPFEVNDGVLSLTRPLDLETVEIMRRTLAEKVNKGFKSGDGTLATATKERELEFRTLIDNFSEPLKQTRDNWRDIMKTKEIFDSGKKVLSMAPEELEELVAGLDDKGLAALRTGFASALKVKSGQNARQSLINTLADLRKNERLNLETLYPSEGFEEISNKILKSRQAFTTEGQTLRGSMTAFTQKAIERQGSAANLTDMADAATNLSYGNMSGAALSTARIVKRTLGKAAEALSEDQVAEISRILVTEDPLVFSRAVRNVEGRERLVSSILRLTQMISGGLGTAAIVAGDEPVGDAVGNMTSAVIASPAEAATPEAQAAYDSVEVPTMQFDEEGATAALIKALRGTDAAAQVQEAAQ